VAAPPSLEGAPQREPTIPDAGEQEAFMQVRANCRTGRVARRGLLWPLLFALVCGIGLVAPRAGAEAPRAELLAGSALDQLAPSLQAPREIRSELSDLLRRMHEIKGLTLGIDDARWIGFGWRSRSGARDWLTGAAIDRLPALDPFGKVTGALDLSRDEVRLAVSDVSTPAPMHFGGRGSSWRLDIGPRLGLQIELGTVGLGSDPQLVHVLDADFALPLSLEFGRWGLRADLLQMGWGTETPFTFEPDEGLQVRYEASLGERGVAGLGVDAGAGASLSADEESDFHASIKLSRAFERIGTEMSAQAALDLQPPEGLLGLPEGSLRIAAAATTPLSSGRSLHLGFEYLHRDLTGSHGAPDHGFTLRLVL
jgi:hypothetical protein